MSSNDAPKPGQGGKPGADAQPSVDAPPAPSGEAEATADSANLRARAMEALRHGRFDLAEEVLRRGEVHLETLVENLRIYQAELEIQNEELKRSQQQAEDALARFSALFTSLPVAELVLDAQGMILDANPAGRELLGLRDTRAHKYFLARLVQESQRGDLIASWDRLGSSESTRLSGIRFSGGGAPLVADLHIARLPSPEGQRTRYVCALLDRTAEVRQRESLLDAYDRLEQSRERYRVLAQFSPDWDYWLGIDGQFLHISPACLEVTGYDAQEFAADPKLLEQIIHPDDLPAWRRHFDEPLDPETDHVPLELRIRCRNGELKWIEHVCRPVQSEDGRPLGRRGVNRDISMRHAAQQALRRSEALLNETGRLARVGGWELDAVTGALRWTDVTRALHEVGPDFKPSLTTGLDFYHPDDRETLRSAVDRALDSGEPYALELRLITARGRRLWVKTTGAPVRGLGGAIDGLRGSLQDINERVDAERALRESESRFRSVFDSAPLGIAVVDQAGRPVMTNTALQRWLGYSAEELAGMTFVDYTHPEDLEDDHAHYAELASGDAPSYSRDKRYIRKDGSVVWGRLTVALIRDDQGAPRFAVGMIADIEEQRAAERALRDSERKYRALFESAGEGMWILQGERFVSGNGAALAMLGQDDPAAVLGRRPTDISPETQPDGEPSLAKQQRILAQAYRGKAQRFEWEHLRADGSPLPLEVTLIPVQLGGEPSLFVTWHDLTERRAAEKREEQARTVFDNTSEGIIITDPEQRILAVNRAFTEITGYSEAEALGARPSILQSGRQDEAFYQSMWATLNTTGQWRGEFWNRRKNGDIYPQLSTISVVRDQSGRITNYIAVFGDITQRKQSEEALYELAHHDALTGLPNRTLLRARVEQCLRRAHRDGSMLALLFLDLDLFKNVNDTLGHTVGDALLQQVAEAMAQRVRDADSIARLGGDEFIVLMEDLRDPNSAAYLARRLLKVFATPFQVLDRELYITASIGISVYPMNGTDLDTLLSNADVAMYQAKDQGRNTYRFFEAEMTEGAIERLRLENALRGALSRDELTLYYQPQVRIADGRLLGLEVLLRWTHPELGEVPPDRFIGIAEEIGIINELGLWVLDQSCRQLAQWDRDGCWVPRIAVNLSVQQLERRALVQRVEGILRRHALSPERLELEITESMLMRHADQVIANLAALRELGMTIAVDDFGSGFSSLAYLKRLPINRLKLDKVFIDQLTRNPDDDAIARAVIALGRGLGLAVLAEGVETPEQLEFLREEGCDEAQGFLFGRPVDAERLVREHRLQDATVDDDSQAEQRAAQSPARGSG